MNNRDASLLLFEAARRRFDQARMISRLIASSAESGECERALAEQAESDATEARFCLLRAVLMLADPSSAWHQNDSDETAPLCSVVVDSLGWRRGFSVVPAESHRWGNELDLVVTELDA